MQEFSLVRPKVVEIVDDLKRDFRSCVSAWSFWEAMNGYPQASRRSRTRELLNSSEGCRSAVAVQVHCYNSTVMALTRMLDSYGDNRSSLPRLASIVDRNKLFDQLLEDLTPNGWVKRTNILAKETKAAKVKFVKWTSPQSTRGISAVFPKLKAVRDNYLAHSLQFPQPSEVNPFLVRDALVLCGSSIDLLSLHLLGVQWYPKEYWRTYLSSANEFWDTQVKGLETQTLN